MSDQDTSGTESPLIAAVRADDEGRVRDLLAAGEDLGARDRDGWAALDWAAGRGRLEVIELLLAAGADPAATAEAGRRPYDIAVAAGHVAAARRLRAAWAAAEPDAVQDHTWRPYCRAYPLAALQRYPGWPDDASPPRRDTPEADEAADIVFLHDDLTVTASMWPGEDVLFADVTESWTRFCADELGFSVPDELDLVPVESPPDRG
jgi:hypothetical protein